MYAFMKTDQYDAIDKTYKTTKGCYVIKFLSEAYTPQEQKAYNGQTSTSVELVVKV